MSKEKSDLEKKRFIGQIKYIESKTYLNIKESKTIEECELESYIFASFNEEGNFLIHIYKSKDSTLDSKKTFKYNSKGNLIEENNYSLKYGYEQYKFKYNLKEVLILSEYCHPNNNKSDIAETTYKYDKKGNLIIMNLYSPNGDLDAIIKYERDSKGYLIEQQLCLSDGFIEAKKTFKRDSNGNLIEKNEYKYKSDEHIQYIYDSQFYIIEENSYNLDGFLLEKIIYKRDTNGNLIEKISYDSDRNVKEKFNYKYEFDHYDNYITKFIMKGDVCRKKEVQKIIYYGDKDENSYPLWDLPSYEGIEIQ